MEEHKYLFYNIFIDFANWDTSKPKYLNELQRKVNSFEHLEGTTGVLFDNEIESRKEGVLYLLDKINKTLANITDGLSLQKAVEVLTPLSEHRSSIKTSIDEVSKKSKSYLTIPIKEIISDYQTFGKMIRTQLEFISTKDYTLDSQEIFDRIFYFYQDLVVYGFYQTFADSFHNLLQYLIDNDYKMPLLPGLRKPPIISTDKRTVQARWALIRVLDYPESIKIIQWDEEKLEKVVMIKYIVTPFALYSAISYSFTEFLINEDRRRLKKCPHCPHFFIAKHITRVRCYSDDCRKAHEREKKRKQRVEDPVKYY